MKKSRLIPFSWTPASWGLLGPAREEAEAAYYYDGHERDRLIAEIRNRDDQNALLLATAKVDHRYGLIDEYDLAYTALTLSPMWTSDPVAAKKAELALMFDHGKISEYDCDKQWAVLDYAENVDRRLALLAIELRHGKITEYDHDILAIRVENPEEGVDYELAKLEVEHKHKNLTENQYQKARATLLEEPWIGIIDQGFDPNKGLEGVYFEFDWNDYWITFLRLNGYFGRTDEEVIDQWFSDVCRAQGVAAMQPGFDGSVIPFSTRAVNKKADD
jgi:hypothetical protein